MYSSNIWWLKHPWCSLGPVKQVPSSSPADVFGNFVLKQSQSPPMGTVLSQLGSENAEEMLPALAQLSCQNTPGF